MNILCAIYPVMSQTLSLSFCFETSLNLTLVLHILKERRERKEKVHCGVGHVLDGAAVVNGQETRNHQSE